MYLAYFSESHERLLKGGSFHNPSLTKHGYSMRSAQSNFPVHYGHLPAASEASPMQQSYLVCAGWCTALCKSSLVITESPLSTDFTS